MIRNQEVLTQDESLEIRRALDKLGLKVAKVWASRFENVGHRRWAVMYHGKCEGIYDLDRKTFVD